MTRFAAAIVVGGAVGWYFGYRQGYLDGLEGIQLQSSDAVGLGEWR